MSSFLAPIHFWLYNKIGVQEDLIRALAQTAESKGFLKGTSTFVSDPLPVLRAAIDLGNIHGWLQDKIADSEQRLASLVTELVRPDAGRMTCIVEAAEQFGKAHAIPEDADAQDARKVITDTLVNGMPCDTVEKVTENTPERVAWENTADLHGPYWSAVNGNPAHYWQIRSAVICGMCAASKLTFRTLDDGAFEITRK